MALSATMIINPAGQTFHPVFNDAVYSVRETTSGIYTAPNFRFICEVVINSVVVAKLKASIYPLSTNYGVFNIGRILESYVLYQSSHTIIATTHASSSYVKYDVRFGYEYSATSTTTPTEYLNVTSVTNRYAFNGAFPMLDMIDYSENDWIPTSVTSKFLTRVRSREIYQGQYDFQTFLIGTTRPDRVRVIAYPSVTTSTFTIPSTSADKMYYCPSGFNLNNITTLISGTAGNVVPSGTTYYTIELLTSTTVRSELYTYYVKDDCSRYANNDLVFLNRLGGLQVIRLPYKRIDTYESGRSFMQRNEYVFSAGNYTASSSRGQRAQWDNKVQQAIVFQSGLIKETEVPLYEDLVSSPIVWIIDGTKLVSITIEDGSFTYKSNLNDKIIQYTINAKLGFKNPTQRL